MNATIRRLLCAALLLQICAAPSHAQTIYHLTDLGALTGPDSTAVGVNDAGEVIACPYQSDSFLYSDGVATDLGTLGGSDSIATGINASGQVVGFSNTTGNVSSHAFLYSGGAMTDLGTLGGTYSNAYGINATGQVVGAADTTGGLATHAFLYSNGTMRDLTAATAGVFTAALAINDAGQIAGDNSTGHAAFYSAGVVRDLGTLGGESELSARGINAAGQVAEFFVHGRQRCIARVPLQRRRHDRSAEPWAA